MSSSEENYDIDDVSGSEFDDYSPAAKKVKPAKSTAKSAPKPSKKTKKILDDNVDDDVEVADEPPPFLGGSSKKEKTVDQKFQKLTQVEHVLKRPDAYIGSVETITQSLWVYDSDNQRMEYREVKYVPGFYKILDEILVNAADNKINDPSMDAIKVEIDVEGSTISVYNNGKGIPIEIHSATKLYVPELIFGHLLSSSNYDDTEKKLTGGRNGYGAKLTNIYSLEFTVETADKNTGQKYKQTWNDNMSKIGKAKITKNSRNEEYTKVTFQPDLERFGMDSIDKDTIALLKKRVYDLAGTIKDIKVSLNGERLKVKNFKSYVDMYISSVAAEAASSSGGAAQVKPTVIYEQISSRWEVAFTVSDGTFQQVSFANSIATTKGGTHVNHIADQIAKHLVANITKKNKGAAIKIPQIKHHMWIFVNSLIENPTFDSQTKETLTLPAAKFGSKPVLSEEFMKKVSKSAIVEHVLNWAKFKADQQIEKTDGAKRSRLTGITKLSDANNAGTRYASQCTLILTEGDSAKSLAVAGLGVVGRDNFGVFPLKGKLLNVREAKHKQIMDNEEIQYIKQILGLKHNKEYSSVDSLRYGKLMIMADQDHDGSHIKGLLINFLDHFYPSLLKIPNFLFEFVTPIIRVTKGKQRKDFYTIPEYEDWYEAQPDKEKWYPKYYKGLGTSNDEDGRYYFSHMQTHMIRFATTREGDRELIDLAFSKKKADERKEWLRQLKPGTFLDHNADEILFSDFINKELILFSMADNIRSIPSIADGLKPGQRKVIWACFKRKLQSEVKVAQLVGYVSEKSAYHHGEVSLAQTIVGLAQNYVGSNNLNLLKPNGQYGTRHDGGKDHASSRYIFTELSPMARAVFHASDEPILTYQKDDNRWVEPEWYMPVVPFVLINGAEGIGTGWSTTIPSYNPVDVVQNIRRLMDGKEQEPMLPWWRGFHGVTKKVAESKIDVMGVAKKIDDSTIEITELPIHRWTTNFKKELESMITDAESLVKEYREHHDNLNVHFVIKMTPKGMQKAEEQGLNEFFKLVTRINTSNMICFDFEGRITKYNSPEEILDAWYMKRLAFYQKRKDWLADELQKQLDKLNNQARFVKMIVDKELVVSNRKKADIVADLRKKNFRPFPKVDMANRAGETEQVVEADEEDAQEETSADYDYLLGMAIWSLTKEKIAKLLHQAKEKEGELLELLEKNPMQIWNEDLDVFLAQWEQACQEWNIAYANSADGKKTKRKQKVLVHRKSLADGGRKAAGSDDDFMPTRPAAKAPTQKARAKAAKAVDENHGPPAPVRAPVKNNGNDSVDVVPTAMAKGKGKAKAAPAPKRKSLDNKEDDDSEEDDMYLKPSKKNKLHVTDYFDKAPGPSTSKAARKVPGSNTKTVPKKPVKKTVDSEDDDDDAANGPSPVPVRNAPQRAARAATKKYIEIPSDSEGDGMFVDED